MPAKKDFTQVAFAVFEQAVGVVPKKAPSAKQVAGRKGGLAGGKTRMANLTEAQKHELAMKGVAARKATRKRKPRVAVVK